MLNFRDNFFFAKFAVLFFILTIFGYWGIDLNSEELYIAFSFFLLVIVGVILSRTAILLMFVKSVNVKYFRILSDLLVLVNVLNLRYGMLCELRGSALRLRATFYRYVEFFGNFLSADFQQLSGSLRAQKALVSSFLPLASSLYLSNMIRSKKFHSFGQVGAKFFSIKL